MAGPKIHGNASKDYRSTPKEEAIEDSLSVTGPFLDLVPD
jgi:hypothetical protein